MRRSLSPESFDFIHKYMDDTGDNVGKHAPLSIPL
jgi:hypothetical protein